MVMDIGEFGDMLVRDVKAFYANPGAKVTANPKTTLIYSVAIKTIGLFVALVSPFIGYALVTTSFLIDFHIVMNVQVFERQVERQIHQLIGEWRGLNDPVAPAAAGQ